MQGKKEYRKHKKVVRTDVTNTNKWVLIQNQKDLERNCRVNQRQNKSNIHMRYPRKRKS